MQQDGEERFEQAARKYREKGILRELLDFLRENRRWWMIPIVAALLLVGVLVFLGSTAAAPFIYTLF